MDVTSTYRYARISALKAREVTREIQGLPVSAALDILTFTPRKAARLVGKTVKAAMADAENNFELSVDALVVKTAEVGEGPAFRRFKPRARGSAAPLRRRTSHIRITLTDDIPLPEPKQKSSGKAGKKGAAKGNKDAAKAPKVEEPAEEEVEATVVPAEEEKAAAEPKSKTASKKAAKKKAAEPKAEKDAEEATDES